MKTDEPHEPNFFLLSPGSTGVAKPKLYRDSKHADYSLINKLLSQTDWHNLLSDSDLDICVNNFYQKLHIIINKNVPLRRTKPMSHPPWYDSELKSLVK